MAKKDFADVIKVIDLDPKLFKWTRPNQMSP